MEINISNLGTIKEGKLELGKLTILGGKNNSGKTYVAYAIYGFIKFWRSNVTVNSFLMEDEVRELVDKGSVSFKLQWLHTSLTDKMAVKTSELSERYYKNLHTIFSTEKDNFQGCILAFSDSRTDFGLHFDKDIEVFINSNLSIKLSCSEDVMKISLYADMPNSKGEKVKREREIHYALATIFLKGSLGETYIITSERTGIHTFQKELDSHRSSLIEQMIRQGYDVEPINSINVSEQLENKTARYSLPIRDNISQVRDLSEAYKQTSFLVEKNPKFEFGAEKVSGVKFNVDENGRITIASKEGEEKFAIDLHLASSSSRALLGLHTYIKHLAKENELLIIDEPELNLHPKNQIYLARLIAELVNNGVRVLITTHSDFFLKEINNLIALHSDFEGKDKIVEDYGYSEDELLSPKDVRAYICGEGTIREVEVDEFGLTETSFDDAMDMINEISEEIAFKKSMNPVKA